jgi:mono/diheme cytochrome c family protein
MVYRLRFIFTVFLTMIVFGKARAVELLPPVDLAEKYDLPSRKVTVVEPHESTAERHKFVDYRVLPLDGLLTHWFGGRWASEDAEIVFFAKDGYRSAVAGTKLKKYRAFLAFARSDGTPFTVDNISQNEQKIPLGPYYLIWDNLGAPELLRQGAYDWPYQITSIEWHSKTEDQILRPVGSSKMLEEGFEETREYCLTCHSIRGIGGKKYPVDLIQATCRWQEQNLKAWIDSPSRIKPGTTMPPLARTLPEIERQRIIERIVGYLKTMQSPSSKACAAK